MISALIDCRRFRRFRERRRQLRDLGSAALILVCTRSTGTWSNAFERAAHEHVDPSVHTPHEPSAHTPHEPSADAGGLETARAIDFRTDASQSASSASTVCTRSIDFERAAHGQTIH
jgi:hypothetical protein